MGDKDDDFVTDATAPAAEPPPPQVPLAKPGPEQAPNGAAADGKGPDGKPADGEAQDGAAQDGSATGGQEAGKRRRGRKGSGKKRGKAPWWELPLLVAVAIAVAVLIKTFLIQPFYIPSQSMEPTLHGCPGCSGDRILVNKTIYDFRSPHPGDIVVFRDPNGQWFNEPTPTPPSNPIVKGFRWFGQLIGVVPPDEHDLVKRVIATGGQTIQGLGNGAIQVSDHGTAGPWHTLNEPFIQDPLTGPDAIFGPVTVPKGRLWVMGDNRANSDDSRYHLVRNRWSVTESTVPINDVIGKAIVIAWPPSRWRTLGTPATFKHEFATAGASGAVPVLGSAALVLPIYGRRRRQRRRRPR